jgi:hypothetical protein
MHRGEDCKQFCAAPRGMMIENYRALIAKYAWRAWRELPPQTRAWMDVDYMIEEAYWWAQHYVVCGKRAQRIRDEEGRLVGWRWRSDQGRRWEPNKGASFVTFLSNQLIRHFMYYNAWLVHPKRLEDKNVSMDGVQQRNADLGFDVEFERILGIPAYRYDPVNACHVGRAFPLLYSRSSPKLKRRIMEWFVRMEPPAKLHTNTQAFLKIKSEFLGLAFAHRLTIDDFRHLYRSPECLDKVSRVITGVPYDLNDPVPGLDRSLWLQA